jgi:hypothetical protein
MSTIKKKLNPLFDTIDQDSDLGRLKRRAMALIKLSQDISNYLPRSTRSITRVANFSNGDLILETGTNKAKLDIAMQSQELIEKIRQKHIPNIRKIIIQINLDLIQRPITNDKRVLSAESAQLLECIAELSPPGLRLALTRLASHKTNLKR